MKKYNVLELCAGAGGLALGIEKAGFKTKYVVDNDKDSIKTLKMNNSKWIVINYDISKLANDGIKNIISVDDIDLISGGFPCQPFSYAGKKMGFKDERGNLFFSFAKIINSVKPKAILFENVKGLLTNDSGKTFKKIKKTLEKSGYVIYHKVLNAWDYSVAQKRQRLFIVGIRKDLNINKFSFPEPSKKKKVLKDVLKDVPNSPFTPYSDKKKKILEMIPPGGCWKNLPDDIAREYMKGSYALGGGKTGIARRISWNEPSLTLTTSPSQMQTERCHPEETRPFTIRESARIQSFPDYWNFYGSISSQYKQIGNAVPVELAKRVAISIKNYLEGVENEREII